MLELLLVRHGLTEWNKKRIVMGRNPIPLCDEGIKQASQIAKFLENSSPEAIISSPVLRAYQTAEEIAKFHNSTKVEKHDGLAEIDYGEWVGKTFEDLLKTDAEVWNTYHHNTIDTILPGGEKLVDTVDRVGNCINDVIERFESGRVILVSHADVLKIAIYHIMKWPIKTTMPLSVDNCSMILIRIRKDSEPRLVFYNSLNGFGNDM